MHIMTDMITFSNATNKPGSCMQHVFKLPNAPQRKAHIDDTTVVHPSNNKCTNKRKWVKVNGK